MEDWNRVPARGARRGWQLTAGVAVTLVLGLWAFRATPWLRRTPDPSAVAGDARAEELAHLKMLGRALKLHADEHDGKFPPSIAEINWRQNLPGMDWAGLPAAVSRFHHPETGKVSDWLYYPGHTENDAPETILAASPVPLGKAHDHRMVVRINGVAEIIAEADFLRPVRDQAAP